MDNDNKRGLHPGCNLSMLLLMGNQVRPILQKTAGQISSHGCYCTDCINRAFFSVSVHVLKHTRMLLSNNQQQLRTTTAQQQDKNRSGKWVS